MFEKGLSCPRCKTGMMPQAERLDLSWAGDGPNAADTDFQGILVDVFSCPSCGSLATRPATLMLTKTRQAAASGV